MNEQIKAIRAEIERRIKEYDDIIESQPDSNLCERYACKWSEGKSLLSFIDSLPEETAPKGYDEAYLNECIAKASKTWEGVDVDKYVDEVRGNRPKLSDSSLEDEMINYWGRIPDDKDLIDTARHFALWQKEQMMKDAEECFVEWYDGLYLNLTTEQMSNAIERAGAKVGDKVKIIIVKEDNQ